MERAWAAKSWLLFGRRRNEIQVSRIGKLPINVPDKVKVTVSTGAVKVEGPKGQLERTLPRDITIKQSDGQLVFERPSDDYKHRALHGLVRSLVANMVTGVNEGFTKHLELVGVGYRVAKQGDELVLSLGYSHPIRFKPPQGISIDVQDPTKFSVSGISIEDVGQVAANLRGLRPPEPYKGKGVMYRGEKIRRKAGKAGKGAKASA
jgi:large subunit ribosomal protein L6